jgi:hypothetical protein
MLMEKRHRLMAASIAFLLLFVMITSAKADSTSIDVSVNATAKDTNGDATFEALSSASDNELFGLVVRKVLDPGFQLEDRPLLEFDISQFTLGEIINSVSFRFQEGAFTSSGSTVNVLGYSGSGTLSISDATTASTLLGSYDPVTLGLGIHSLSLDSSYLQSLIGSSNFLGLRLQSSGGLVNTSQTSMEQAALSLDFFISPHLDIDFTPVPEPTTILLLGSGLIGLTGYGRKKFFKK